MTRMSVTILTEGVEYNTDDVVNASELQLCFNVPGLYLQGGLWLCPAEHC